MKNNIVNLVNEFNSFKTNKTLEELNLIAEKIIYANLITYDECFSFVKRRYNVSDFEIEKWDRLAHYKPACKKTSVTLFDTAFGSGRDLLIAKKLGYDTYGCELNNFLFYNFCNNNICFQEKLTRSDMRNIPFEDNMFDVIRHNASFLHMPIIARGYTIHKSLEESYRLLKNDGILYIYTKEGEGFNFSDTYDGLGIRSFQYFTEFTITKLLQEVGFHILEINRYTRPRNDFTINWIEVFSQKK